MKIYTNFFAYLIGEQTFFPERLSGSDRPVIILEEGEIISEPSWLIPLGDKTYEIAFPYLKPGDKIPEKYDLAHNFNLDISGSTYTLKVTDEILDSETIKEENQIPEWQKLLGERLTQTTSNLIRLLVGMFNNIFRRNQVKQTNILLIYLPEKLNSFSIQDANLPIVVSLDRRYQLRHKLEIMTEKLRHHLRRQAELMSVGKIQEMDSYCLRDYVRRPGLNAVEKAGSKQQLMGIQRYQDFNTPENKFIVYFSQILHLNCFEYQRGRVNEYDQEIKKLRLTIDLFKSQPVVKGIQDKQYRFTQPNYVLQQNAIYRSFYQAYLDYLTKKYEKEKIWSFRNRLLVDSVYLWLTAALLKFQDVNFDVNSTIQGTLVPQLGGYVNENNKIKIQIFLQDQVYAFELNKTHQDIKCDFVLNLEIHQLNSKSLEIPKFNFPIWIFWYLPKKQILIQMNKLLTNSYLNYQKIIVFYLEVLPDSISNNSSDSSSNSSIYFNNRIWLIKLPELNSGLGFSIIIEKIAKILKKILETSL